MQLILLLHVTHIATYIHAYIHPYRHIYTYIPAEYVMKVAHPYIQGLENKSGADDV